MPVDRFWWGFRWGFVIGVAVTEFVVAAAMFGGKG